jgi:hypothetical protein
MVSVAKMVRVAIAMVVLAVAGCDGDSEPGDGGDASGGSGGSGGTGGMPLTCLDGVAGIWVARGFPAYLEINSACLVTLFCDTENDYHSTGYVDGDVLVVTDIAVKTITVEGDVLTIIDASGDIDLPFDRQTSPDAIPAECRI